LAQLASSAGNMISGGAACTLPWDAFVVKLGSGA
jgi:hypothetical protein